jgi:hypothetical protein
MRYGMKIYKVNNYILLQIHLNRTKLSSQTTNTPEGSVCHTLSPHGTARPVTILFPLITSEASEIIHIMCMMENIKLILHVKVY